MRCPTSFFLRLLLRLKSRPHLAGSAVGDWSCRLPACLREGVRPSIWSPGILSTQRRAELAVTKNARHIAHAPCAFLGLPVARLPPCRGPSSLVPRPTSVSLCVRSFSMSPSLTVPAGSVKGWVVGGLSETYLMLSYFLLSAFWLPSDWPSTFA